MPRTPPPCQSDVCAAWFTGRLPGGWFTAPLDVTTDKDEILVVGTIAPPENVPDGQDETAAIARIAAFREETRPTRMEVADIAQHRWQRVVSWGVRCGTIEERFTMQSVPVMTRLHLEDRLVLDTLIDAGVARSRSEALAWCVRQVGQNQDVWIRRLREAMTEVERIRAEGPGDSWSTGDVGPE